MRNLRQAKNTARTINKERDRATNLYIEKDSFDNCKFLFIIVSIVFLTILSAYMGYYVFALIIVIPADIVLFSIIIYANRLMCMDEISDKESISEKDEEVK